MKLGKVALLTHGSYELNELAQKILLGYGYTWGSGATGILRVKSYIIHTPWDNECPDRMWWLGKDSYFLEGKEFVCIDLAPFKALFEQPETIELNGEKYLKSELEEALKHIKPIE